MKACVQTRTCAMKQCFIGSTELSFNAVIRLAEVRCEQINSVNA